MCVCVCVFSAVGQLPLSSGLSYTRSSPPTIRKLGWAGRRGNQALGGQPGSRILQVGPSGPLSLFVCLFVCCPGLQIDEILTGLLERLLQQQHMCQSVCCLLPDAESAQVGHVIGGSCDV